jgi:hypothetical protein
MKEYSEEFYILNVREGHSERNEEKNSMYINGLRYETQEDISMMKMRTMEYAYQETLKEEDKLAKKQIQ